MKQVYPQSLAALITAGTKCSAGAEAHAAELSLTVGTPVLIDGDLNALVSAKEAHEVGKTDLSTLKAAVRSKQRALYSLLFVGRDLLKRKLGNQFSGVWDGTGFNTSLKVPRSVAKLRNTAVSLKAYLDANPTMEVPTILTAELVETALDELTAAEKAATVKKAAVGAQLTARRGKEQGMRLRLSWVVDELSRVLTPLDDRWTAFGFNKPGIKQKPTVPQKLTVGLLGNNTLVARWERSDRVEYYRIWLKIDGQGDEFVPVATSSDLEFTKQDLPAQTKVWVGISAVNNGGESAMSEIGEVTTK